MNQQPIIHQIMSIRATAEAGVYLVHADITDASGERFITDRHCLRDGDPHGINPLLRDWLANTPHTILPHDEVN